MIPAAPIGHMLRFIARRGNTSTRMRSDYPVTVMIVRVVDRKLHRKIRRAATAEGSVAARRHLRRGVVGD